MFIFGCLSPGVDHPMLIHIDGDAFFASVYQAMHANARGKPVVIGQERGMATALSYEAKKLGVKRGMTISEARRICPKVIIATSDYRAYQVFSNKVVSYAEKITPHVERYSIDEVFMDVTGLDKAYNTTYEEIARTLKHTIEKSLGITVSVGIAETKTLAKIASNALKPAGFLKIDETNRLHYLHATAIEDVWGIGRQLTERLKILGIYTAYDFTHQSEMLIRSQFNKMVLETWLELQGTPIYSLSTGLKEVYQSIQKTGTVVPGTSDPILLLSRIFHHIESAFVKARRYHYRVGKIDIFLKTQQFTYASASIKLPASVQFPFLIRGEIRKAFYKVYRPHILYRATGCTLSDFKQASDYQQGLFAGGSKLEDRLAKLYPLYESRGFRFGSDLYEKPHDKGPVLFKSMKLS